MSDRESSDEEVYEVEQIQDHRYNNSKKVRFCFSVDPRPWTRGLNLPLFLKG